MDGDGLLVFGAGIDLAKVPSLERKRIVAFVNFFALQSVSLLTEFASVCEHRFAEINLRIERARTSLAILEAKLASIPDLVSVAPIPPTSSTRPTEAVSATVTSPIPPPPPLPPNGNAPPPVQQPPEPVQAEAPPPPPPAETSRALDPAYQRFVRLTKVGIPLVSFRAEMIRSGLDPNVLEAYLAGGALPTVVDNSDTTGNDAPAPPPPPPPPPIVQPVPVIVPPIAVSAPEPSASVPEDLTRDDDSDIDTLSSASSFDDED